MSDHSSPWRCIRRALSGILPGAEPGAALGVFGLMSFAGIGGAGEADAWILASDDTEIRISMAGDRAVITRLGMPGDAVSWLGAPVAIALPAQWSPGRAKAPATPLTWRFRTGIVDGKSGTLTLTFASSDPDLIYRQCFQGRPGPGPIRQWAEVENRSGAEISLAVPPSLVLTAIDPGGPAKVWWASRGGNNAQKQGGTFNAPVAKGLDQALKVGPIGTAPIPWLAVQADSAKGIYLGWEYSGNGTLRAVAGREGNAVDLSFAVAEATLPVATGAILAIPPAFVGCYRGDLDDGSYRLHRFYLDRLRPPMPKDCPDPILTSNVFFQADTEAGMMTQVKQAQAFGFEAFVVDAVWFPGNWQNHKGPWIWDEKRFPQGGRPFQEFCVQHQMRFGLWCAWGRNFDQATELTQRLVSDNRLDYFKHDMGLIPGGSYERTMGYYRIQEALLRKFPDLILENCDAGGCIKDFGAMSRAHYIVTTDDLSALSNRQGIYDSTFAFPPLVLQNYTWLNSDKPGPYLWRSGMMGAWVLDTPPLPDHADSIRQATATYKRWIRPILQDCKVHHILPRPDGRRWDGMFYWSEKLGRGVVFIFRPQSHEPRQTIKLKGLEATAVYDISSEDGSVPAGSWTGADLMTTGLGIALPTVNSSDLIFLTKKAG